MTAATERSGPELQDADPVEQEAPLPLFEDNERFAPKYTPEKFSEKDERILRLFFSNVDRQIFASRGIPEQVIAALSSRYSRLNGSLRRIFLDEYINPILHPERRNDWKEMDPEDRLDALDLSHKFKELVRFLEKNGDTEEVLNSEKAQAFFHKWLAGYGDDSIAELGGAHVLCERISNISANAIESQSYGASFLEKSSRFMEFGDTDEDGEYHFTVPGELRGTPEEEVYLHAMRTLFDLYTQLREPYLEYVRQRYPRRDDESERAFKISRLAKQFDDLRELLPFATQTNVAINANGRAYEEMINRLLSHSSGEVRWLAQQIHRELKTVVPSFVERPETKRGAENPRYRRELADKKRNIVDAALADLEDDESVEGEPPHWVNLLRYTEDADIVIVAHMIISTGNAKTIAHAYVKAGMMTPERRQQMIEDVMHIRFHDDEDQPREKVRFKSPSDEINFVVYEFDVCSRAGDFRDLRRHRIVVWNRMPFTTDLGFDLDTDVIDSPFANQMNEALEVAKDAYEKIREAHGAEIAQYAVPFAALQNYSMQASAGQVYWIVELRSGPQGRPHYREIAQQIADRVIDVHPWLFSNMRVDREDHRLARRESAKRQVAREEAMEAGRRRPRKIPVT